MGYSPVTIPSITPQYTTEEQDVTGRSGATGAGSIYTGNYLTTAFTGSSTTITGLLGSGCQCASVGDLAAYSMGTSGYGSGSFTINTSAGYATFTYTSISTLTLSGLTQTTALAGGSTITNGAIVFFEPHTFVDIGFGASIQRGVGSNLGTTDHMTLLTNRENNINGLIAQNYGFVPCIYTDVYGETFQWNVNTGTGSAASSLGSPMVLSNSGSGGHLASSLLLTSASTIPSDNRTFRRVILFFQKQTNGDGIKFATTGTVVTGPTLDTNGSGLACWDSGDLGYQNAGTGFTATWETHVSGSGGAGVVLIGALYLQTAGINGVVNCNLSSSGTDTGDYASTATAGSQSMAFFAFLSAIGMAPRRLFTGDIVGNDSLQTHSIATVLSNLSTFFAALKTALPSTEIVFFFPYNVGTAGTPGVGNSLYQSTWYPACQAQSVASGVTFVDGYSRFGDCSYTGTNGVTGEPQLTIDNVHFGVALGVSGTVSSSGLSGQETLAEMFFNKLAVSQHFILSGTIQDGTATDGKITSTVGTGTALGSAVQQVQLFANTADTSPVAALLHANSGVAVPPGLYLGPGGVTAQDVALVRNSAGKLAAVPAVGTSGSSLIQAGTDTSKAITFSSSLLGSISSTTPFTLCGSGGILTTAIQDAMLYIQSGGTAATFILTMGPSTGSEHTVWASESLPVRQLVSTRIPAGWLVIITFTSADINQISGQTC